jgi:signal transduction histidine kinase
VFAAVKMQLGVMSERFTESDPPVAARLLRAVVHGDDGMRGISKVVYDQRPSLLDDLGLLPALRSLVADYQERRGLPVTIEGPTQLPVLSDEAEVALFRALQEALANVARHASSAPTRVLIRVLPDAVVMRISDSGPGFAGEAELSRAESEGHLGLVGMRERIVALGGTAQVRSAVGAGVDIEIQVPIFRGDEA